MIELRLKKLREGNDLSEFVYTIYDYFFNKIKDLEDSLNNENDPLHYLIIKIRLEEVRKALNMFEDVVDCGTEYVEVEAKKNE